MKINIGAGTTKYEGFLNCDHSDVFKPDYVFDLEKDKYPFEDNSVDEVIAYHVLEHLGEGYFHCLKELYRICKPGAKIFIKVPHFRNENQFHDPTHRRTITFEGLRLFSKKFNLEDSDSSSKLGLIFDVDFEVIRQENTFNDKHPLFGKWERLSPADFRINSFDRVDVYDETHVDLIVVK